jgi:hypothetical protein
MKTKQNKLSINKTTIANLSQVDMNNLKAAGITATQTACNYYTCASGLPVCLTTQRCD